MVKPVSTDRMTDAMDDAAVALRVAAARSPRRRTASAS